MALVLGTQITGFSVGSSIDVLRTITNVNQTDPLVKAWFTLKSFLTTTGPSPLFQTIQALNTGNPPITQADPGILQKAINAISNQIGIGFIISDGGLSGIGTLLFNLTFTDTSALVAEQPYVFSIKTRTIGGKVDELEQGVLYLNPAVATITS